MRKATQKIPWFLDQKWMHNDFWKIGYQSEIKMKKLIELILKEWHFCNIGIHLLKHGRFGHENKMF